MKIAIMGDLHFISEQDPLEEAKEQRAFFKDAYGSYLELAGLIREESPDLVISLGDLVDWYSAPNANFALEMLEHLGCRWEATPGNHDFASYRRDEEGRLRPGTWPEGIPIAKAGWDALGVPLGNRVIDAGDTRLVLMDSAISSVPEGTESWLNSVLRQDGNNIVFTHVPVNVPEMAQYILSVDPRRSLEKYVQSGAPHLFETCLRGKVRFVFSGHLHFPGHVEVDGTHMQMLPLSIVSVNREVQDQGQATILELDTGIMRRISVNPSNRVCL